MSSEDNKVKPDQVSWNLAAKIAEELASHLANASINYIGGKPDKCFYYLKLIKNRVIQNLNADERSNLKELEEKITGLIALSRLDNPEISSKLNPDLIDKIKKNNPNKLSDLMVSIDDYNESLMDLLQKYGFLFGVKSDKTKMVA